MSAESAGPDQVVPPMSAPEGPDPVPPPAPIPEAPDATPEPAQVEDLPRPGIVDTHAWALARYAQAQSAPEAQSPGGVAEVAHWHNVIRLLALRIAKWRAVRAEVPPDVSDPSPHQDAVGETEP